MFSCNREHSSTRSIYDFSDNWKFYLGDLQEAKDTNFNDDQWRMLDLPHDWSIEGSFDENSPAGVGGGALTGGTGWYRKNFVLQQDLKGKKVFLQFDGIYHNSEVWINGNYLGKRPNGYISFEYDVTPHVKFGDASNVVAVKVDNAQQPNSRWYSGSGIYRDVRLVITDEVYIPYHGTFITTPEVTEQSAKVKIDIEAFNASGAEKQVDVTTSFYSFDNKEITKVKSEYTIQANKIITISQEGNIDRPKLWSIESPNRYKAITQIENNGKLLDEYVTTFGIRTFSFDSAKGFTLNSKPLKIKGVCLHHDLGCLGAAFHVRAAQRQLEIMREMGVNAIRTSHNPPAPGLLELCDSMGFIVMDEMFDMWKKKKTDYDYSLNWDDWHKKDLEDFVKRDRNHPSVMIWSIGNEIGEQYDSTGTAIATELAGIVRALDRTRPITAANNQTKNNYIIKSGSLDLIGYNYHHSQYEDFPKDYPGKKFIAAETTSALATRGHYDMPSDSIRRWPIRWDEVFTKGNPDNTVSAYDNVSAPWGSTHEETWKIVKKHGFLSGMFIWTGFDYLGEPTPYIWPSRSSYFGVVDLAGFPKDAYYMYQSEWTEKPVLHVFPHWTWKRGQLVDVWAYYNQADEVELFVNDESQGVKKKTGEDLYVMWHLAFKPGVLKAISRKNGKEIMVKEIRTAGEPWALKLIADRSSVAAGGKDLSFITVQVLDKDGNIVPHADNLIKFNLTGGGNIIGVDNGNPVSHESFKARERKAFNGLALAVVQSSKEKNMLTFSASAAGLEGASIQIKVE
ncbi:beta-galactosidase GalB [Chryseosolibacter indicus]|uniref:DUF4982 domain-containing protein n=1 Tax=Chryseosolibacter indicus TaxID=2782351 RepID=A0ABS5VL54_9BACT|nr:beta-galactosidase GalB [Chryseosolibacter indicus]MBT1702178.1 DUF4982 domain-containing protein [Chryseosolibacter indicus]